jgi:hypothetical protein
MSIIVCGVEMPKNCSECKLVTQYYDGGPDICCLLDKRVYCKARLDNCPLVAMPTPHEKLFGIEIKTNRDKLFAMSNEELAWWLENLLGDIPWCNDKYGGKHLESGSTRCQKWDCCSCCMEWLESEVKE